MRLPPSRNFTLQRTQLLPLACEELFAFFADPWNLEAITPPWLRFRIVEAPERLGRGSVLRYRLRVFGWPIRWRTEISGWSPPRAFADVQVAGPYPLWEHEHRFTGVAGGTEIFDHVRYRVPGGPFAPLVHRTFVSRWLDEIFDYRRERLFELLGGGDTARGGRSVSNEPPSA
jgi:ligand-binding SRPBCC domain-containing protein